MSSQVKGSAKIADHNKILCCVSMITYWMITLIYVYIIQSQLQQPPKCKILNKWNIFGVDTLINYYSHTILPDLHLKSDI